MMLNREWMGDNCNRACGHGVCEECAEQHSLTEAAFARITLMVSRQLRSETMRIADGRAETAVVLPAACYRPRPVRSDHARQ
jgi:hypothetical protein